MKGFIAGMLAAGILVAGCGKSGPTREQLAAMTAKGYYQHLQQGHADGYLAGLAGYDSMPDSYKAELKTNIRMFLHQQTAEHGGIASVADGNAVSDTSLNVVYAMLNIQFRDSTREEICVPMVEKDGRWLMK